MRLRTAVLAAVLMTVALPLAARAGNCAPSYGGDNRVVISSFAVVTAVDTNQVGCTVKPNSQPGEPTNTDFLLPRSNAMIVSYRGTTLPISELSTLTFTGIRPLGPNCTGSTCLLEFDTWSGSWDSKTIVVDGSSTVSGGTATAKVCLQEADDGTCTVSESHTYRTVG